MNVKELKEKIKDLPDHMDVFIEQNDTEFPISMVNSAEAGDRVFSDGKVKGTDRVLVLSDDI